MSSPARYSLRGDVAFSGSDLSPKPGIIHHHGSSRKSDAVGVMPQLDESALTQLLAVAPPKSRTLPGKSSFDSSGVVDNPPSLISPNGAFQRERCVCARSVCFE
jgi:hypothetical protein